MISRRGSSNRLWTRSDHTAAGGCSGSQGLAVREILGAKLLADARELRGANAERVAELRREAPDVVLAQRLDGQEPGRANRDARSPERGDLVLGPGAEEPRAGLDLARRAPRRPGFST